MFFTSKEKCSFYIDFPKVSPHYQEESNMEERCKHFGLGEIIVIQFVISEQ